MLNMHTVPRSILAAASQTLAALEDEHWVTDIRSAGQGHKRSSYNRYDPLSLLGEECHDDLTAAIRSIPRVTCQHIKRAVVTISMTQASKVRPGVNARRKGRGREKPAVRKAAMTTARVYSRRDINV